MNLWRCSQVVAHGRGKPPFSSPALPAAETCPLGWSWRAAAPLCSAPCPSALTCDAGSICWYTWCKFTLPRSHTSVALQTAFSLAFLGAQTAGTDVKTWLTTVKVIVPSRSAQMLCLSAQQPWFTDTVPTDGTQEELRDHKTDNTKIYIALKIHCLCAMLRQILRLQTQRTKIRM